MVADTFVIFSIQVQNDISNNLNIEESRVNIPIYKFKSPARVDSHFDVDDIKAEIFNGTKTTVATHRLLVPYSRLYPLNDFLSYLIIAKSEVSYHVVQFSEIS